MRRLTAMLLTMICLFALTARSEAAMPELRGHWQTQADTPEERLTLVLWPDDGYHETRNEGNGFGSWKLDGSTVSLSGGTYSPARTLTWDGAVLSLDGQPMQRFIPEPEGLWVGYPENESFDFIMLYVGKEHFVLHYTVIDGDAPALPYGGYWFEGTYWLEGTWRSTESGLTLTTTQGDVFPFPQDPVTGFLMTEGGCLLFRYD